MTAHHTPIDWAAFNNPPARIVPQCLYETPIPGSSDYMDEARAMAASRWPRADAEKLEYLARSLSRIMAQDARVKAHRARMNTKSEIPAQGGGGPEVDEGQTEALVATQAPRAKPQRQRHEPQEVTAGETAPNFGSLASDVSHEINPMEEAA